MFFWHVDGKELFYFKAKYIDIDVILFFQFCCIVFHILEIQCQNKLTHLYIVYHLSSLRVLPLTPPKTLIIFVFDVDQSLCGIFKIRWKLNVWRSLHWIVLGWRSFVFMSRKCETWIWFWQFINCFVDIMTVTWIWFWQFINCFVDIKTVTTIKRIYFFIHQKWNYQGLYQYSY